MRQIAKFLISPITNRVLIQLENLIDIVLTVYISVIIPVFNIHTSIVH